MKNKKGFTLVELLAVIAILAILMLLIMPNVLGMFSKGKKNAFKVQVGNIVESAQKQIQTDTLEGKNINLYCEGLDECEDSKQLSVSENGAKYQVTFNRKNNVKSIAIEDGNYCYVSDNYNANINEEDLVEGKPLTCINGVCVCENLDPANNTYVYWNHTITYGRRRCTYENGKCINYTVEGELFTDRTYPSNALTSYETLGNLFFRTTLNNGYVLGHEICAKSTTKTTCFKKNAFDNIETGEELKPILISAGFNPYMCLQSQSLVDNSVVGGPFCFDRTNGTLDFLKRMDGNLVFNNVVNGVTYIYNLGKYYYIDKGEIVTINGNTYINTGNVYDNLED